MKNNKNEKSNKKIKKISGDLNPTAAVVQIRLPLYCHGSYKGAAVPVRATRSLTSNPNESQTFGFLCRYNPMVHGIVAAVGFEPTTHGL
jgi:hypothetical protein